jgi:hypothetical protein
MMCLIPGMADLYEVVVLSKEGDNLVVETYEMVGPAESKPREKKSWLAGLRRQLPEERHLQAALVLPRPIGPVSTEARLVNRTVAPLVDAEARPNAALLPTLRREGKKYGFLSGKAVSEDGIPQILYVVLGGRYFGGYLFSEGSPKVTRVEPVRVAGTFASKKQKTFWIRHLLNAYEPIIGPKVLRVTTDTHEYDVDDDYGDDEWDGPEEDPAVGTRTAYVTEYYVFDPEEDPGPGRSQGTGSRHSHEPGSRGDRAYLQGRVSFGLFDEGRRLPIGRKSPFTFPAFLAYTIAQYAELPNPIEYVKSVLALSNRTGVPLTHLMDKPDDDLTKFTSSPAERHRYAKVYVETGSADKALKAIFPNVRGKAKYIRALGGGGGALGQETSLARQIKDIFNFGPSLASVVPTEDWGDRLWVPRGVDADSPWRAVKQVVHYRTGRGGRATDMPTATELRVLLFRKKYKARQIDQLYDSIRMLRRFRDHMPETRNGALYLAHFLERDWPQVMRDHDGILAVTDDMRRRGIRGVDPTEMSAKELKALRAKTAALSYVPGIRPLLTDDDFRAEADVLRHCIWHHKRQPYHHASIIHPETGERSTAQFTTRGTLIQHYGTRNARVSENQAEYLAQFLVLNFPDKGMQRRTGPRRNPRPRRSSRRNPEDD